MPVNEAMGRAYGPLNLHPNPNLTGRINWGNVAPALPKL
jgi:hypothetical protein